MMQEYWLAPIVIRQSPLIESHGPLRHHRRFLPVRRHTRTFPHPDQGKRPQVADHFAEFNTASKRYIKDKKIVEYEYTNEGEKNRD
jgi:hypothetical protein